MEPSSGKRRRALEAEDAEQVDIAKRTRFDFVGPLKGPDIACSQLNNLVHNCNARARRRASSIAQLAAYGSSESGEE